jgi:hypothetical protein
MKSLLLFATLVAHVVAITLPASDLARRSPRRAPADPQKSLTVDPDVIADGFADDGSDTAEEGQEASLTSTNNFINFCLTGDLPITNGQQVAGGSCNPAPMGFIPDTDNMPSAKFVSPPNGGKVKANKAFTIEIAIKNLATGHFTNPLKTYYAAPQQLNSGGQILGHSHVVIESLSSLGQTTPTNPKKFVFFKGINDKAQGGVLSTEVAGGVPKGVYKISTINSAANHQPVLVAVAQRGSVDDVAYVRLYRLVVSFLINCIFWQFTAE